MRRRLALILAVALLAAPEAGAEPARPAFRPRPPVVLPRFPRRRLFPPIVRFPRIPPHRVPPLLPAPPPEEFEQPPPFEPGAPPLDAPVGPRPPLGHGFQLTVPVGAGAGFAVPATLSRYVDVGQALGACFPGTPGLAWSAVTLRVSFRRDGSVFGEPRIPYSDAGTPEQKVALARSVLAALKACAPLRLSPSLGEAIAGEIFAIRFIHQDKP